MFILEFDYAKLRKLESKMKQLELSFSQDWRKIYLLGAEIFPMYERLWNGYDYLVTLHLMKMVQYLQKIMAKEGKKFILEEDYTEVVSTTLKHLAVTHGKDHKFYKECEKFATEYKELIELREMIALHHGIELLRTD